MDNSKNFRSIPYDARRKHFFSEIVKEVPNAVAIIPAHSELPRNDDVNFKFRQNSSFHYLTGFDEPDAIAVLRNVHGRQEYVMFVRPKDVEKEIWTGYRAGVDGVVTGHGVDRAYPIDEFDKMIVRLLQGADRVYYGFAKTLHKNGVEYLDEKILRLLDVYKRSLGRSGKTMLPIFDSDSIIGEMRLFKAPEEVERLRHACHISAEAHKEVMARSRPGLYEYQLEGLIEFMFRNAGCSRFGYPSIVAGGPNATILHYTQNDRKLEENDLVLIDAGGEFQYYTADITRTYPVSGKMIKEQLEVYEAVLRIQKECVAMVRPGQTMAALHDFVVESTTDALLTLGLLSGDPKRLIETQAFRQYFPHGTGHLLGMDVHDIGLYQINGEPRRIEPGMVFTVEPGIYIQPGDTQAPVRYRGIGVRIEDDVLVTPEGYEVMTSKVPKEAKDLTGLIASKPWIELWN